MEKITSRKNSTLIHAKKLGKDRNYRLENGEFLCDGKKLLREAVTSGAGVISVFTSMQPDIMLSESVKAYQVSTDILSSVSPLKNPQDVLFICKIPEQTGIDIKRGTHLLLDNVQDPGNVGTVLRSADAFGIDSVILTPGCADPYNPKAIRASMGAVFRQKVIFKDIGELHASGARFIGTASSSEYTDIRNADFKDCVIVLGNEGQGISGELLALCKEMITIPVSAGCESLNIAAAASIIMWEISKTQTNSEVG